MSRWVIADDTDPEITYNGDWIDVQGLFNSSKAGVSVQNAIAKSGHKLTSNGTLAFPFIGTEVAVFGVSSALSNSTAGAKATIECFVDGQSIGGLNTFGVFPWTSYCNTTGLADGQHLLTATVTADEENPFWLDFIRYAPASGPIIAGKLLMIDSTDPAIEYTASAAWSTQGTVNVTTIGAVPAIKLNFTGTSLTWFSPSSDTLSKTNINPRLPEDDLAASLDGRRLGIGFPVLQGPDFSYNKILFEAKLFAPEDHTFAMDFSPASPSQEALALDFFLIQVAAVGTISASTPLVAGPSTVVVSAIIPTRSLSGSQAPQTTNSTGPTSQGISNDISVSLVAFAMLAITLLRVMGL